MTPDKEYERIVSSFIDGTRILVPKWFQTRRGRDVPTPPFHYEIEDLVLAESRDGVPKHPRLAIRAPRGHAKSTILSKSFNLWRILMSACVELVDEYIVIYSGSFRQCHNWFRAMVNHLETNEKIKYYFGRPRRGNYWRFGDGDVVLRFDTPGGHREIRFRVAGSDMELRGDQEDNIRPTVVTLDDITKEKESRTETGRQAQVDWVLSAVMPSVDPDGRIINIGTPRPYDDDWNAGIIEKLAESDDPNERWHLVTYQSIPDMGSPEIPVLWPERHSRESLLGLLESWKKIGREALWWSEFQCKVVGESGRAFPDEWYKPFRWDGTLVRHAAGPYLQVEGVGRIPVSTFVGIDSAFSKARKADHTVISAWGVGRDRGFYQIERVKRRGMSSPDAIREAVHMGARNQAQHVMFERVGAQEALAQFANEYQDELKRKGELAHFMAIKDYPPGNRASKEDRIKTALQTPYAMGRVHHKDGIHLGIENELSNFPSVHPDELDSCYYAFIEAYPPSHAAPAEVVSLVEEASPVEVDWLTGVVTGGRPGPRTRANRRTD